MFPAALLVTTLLLAISISASPVAVTSSGVTLPFAKRINTSGGPFNVVQQDQARISALVSQATGGQLGRRDVPNVPINNVSNYQPQISYVASVGVGNPSTQYNLLVELGSSNTWVGADKKWKPTKGSKDTGQPVEVIYTTTFFSGEEWLDTVDLGSGLVISDQSIGVANTQHGYGDGIDGMLGLGPAALTLGTLFNQPLAQWPAVTDNLYNQGTIPEDAFSLVFTPSSNGISTTGELTFGGTDPRKYVGDVSYAPFTTTKPSSAFWGLNMTISYGNNALLTQTAGMVDASVSLVLLAPGAYDAYQNATGAVKDEATAMLKLSTSQYNKLENLNFDIGSAIFSLTPNGQIWPRVLNTYISGTHGAIYSVVGLSPILEGYGLDYTLGQTFLERFYGVFDTTHNRIGFAITSNTEGTFN